jgi:hypothetical protein
MIDGKTCLCALVSVSLLAWSCSPEKPLSRFKNESNDVFVALNEPETGRDNLMQISFPKKIDAELCLTGKDGACEAGAETFPLKEVTEAGGRVFYKPTQKPQLTTLLDYLIVNTTGQQLLRFRLKNLVSDGSISDALSMLSIDSLREELTFITQDKFRGRLAGTPENREIGDFIINQLKQMKIEPVFSDYRQDFPMTTGPTKGRTSSNIIGLIEGSDPQLKNEYVVIGAHMDHTGTLELGYTCSPGGRADSICNGADDNGSGTVTLLNVAKSLAAMRGSLKRSVLVMWFSGEEEGLLGSRHYVANPAVPLNKHVFMINLDMVGYAKTFGDAIAAIGTVTSKWGGAKVRELSRKYTSHKIKFTEKVDGGSDHAPFMNRGVPGVFYHTGVSNNPNYHRTSDHVDRIDFDGMLVAGKLALETVVAASEAPELTRSAGLGLVALQEKFVSDAEAAKGCHYLADYKYID